jgi:enterochelin esterase-like enzyme
VTNILDWELVYGTVPTVITVLGALAGVALITRRHRRWWVRVVPALLLGTVLVCLLILWIMDGLWQPFPDKLPLRVLLWIGAALFAIGLAVATLPNARWWRGGLALLAAVLVITTSVMKINAFYGQYPTLRQAFGLPPANEIAFANLHAPTPDPYRPAAGEPLLKGWRPPPGMPTEGNVTQIPIPGTESGFPVSRNAYIYVPPAYQTGARPLLPVLVLLHGQPGGPIDWLNGGQLSAAMDRFAAAHNGLAPVVVLPDATGGTLTNPLCTDSKLGKAETYLARDVPDWIRRNLQVDLDTRHWAVGGFSYGGTCALQLGVRKPQLFPTFIDISGQLEPTLGNRQRTVAEAFNGDEAAFRRINPLDLMAGTPFPASAGMIAVGDSDPDFRGTQRQVLEACKRARMSVQWLEVRGGHNWPSASASLNGSVNWLAGRMGLVQP